MRQHLVKSNRMDADDGCRNAKRHGMRDLQGVPSNTLELHQLFKAWLRLHRAAHTPKHRPRAIALALGVPPETFYRITAVKGKQRPGHFTDVTLTRMSARLRIPASQLLACVEQGLAVPLEFPADGRRKKVLTPVT